MQIGPGLLLAASLALTSACGGGSAPDAGGGGPAPQRTGPPPPPVTPQPEARLDPVSQRTGFPAGSLQRPPGYNSTDDRFVFPNDQGGGVGGFITLPRSADPKLTGTPFLSAYATTDTIADLFTAVRGALPSGAGTAHALRKSQTGTPARLERGHERLGDTVLPRSGGATFEGGYMGVLGEATTLAHRGFVTGTVSLTAAFDRMTISGTIAGRINDSERNFDPLDLTESAIDPRDGSFGGPTARGRQIDLPGFDGATGRYGGLIVGATGEAVVGSVEVTHQRFGVDAIREWGAFVAE